MIVEAEELKPKVGTEGSAGFDLRIKQDIQLKPYQTIKVGTGVKVEIPTGCMGLVVPRSSTGRKGIELTNTVGVIDSDYQGEIFFEIRNVSNTTFLGYRGDRLMQLVLVPCLMDKIVYVNEFSSATERGEDGFGSTGDN